MHTIKFILQQSFCLIFLTANLCSDDIKKIDLPKPTLNEPNKPNNSPITITSTSDNAVVCIGQRNKIYMGITDQAAPTNQGIEDLDNNRRDNQPKTITDGAPIIITQTAPNGTVIVGQNNTVYRYRPPQLEQITPNEESNDNNNTDDDSPEDESSSPEDEDNNNNNDDNNQNQ